MFKLGLSLDRPGTGATGPTSEGQPPTVEAIEGSMAEIVTHTQSVQISLVGSGAYDGTYLVQSADMAAGPVNLVPPLLSGDADPTVGEVLTIVPGLWVYDGENTEPVPSWTCSGAGSVSGLTYTIVAEDAGATLTVTEQVVGGNGTRFAVSNPVLVG